MIELSQRTRRKSVLSTMTNLVGSTLGPYQIVELIGESEIASVYKAWQPSLQRYLALKVLAPHLADDVRFLDCFQREMVAAANLKHVNILTVYDVGAEGDHHYVVTAFVEGVSLAERLRAGSPMPPDQVVDVISQLGSALDYAHQRGFMHRDVRPANLLIDPEGRAVLADLGMAQALSDSGDAGPAFGDPHYMSPEQARGEALDHRSDLYSLGIVCYEMLAGALPFGGDTPEEVLYAQANEPLPPLREANLALPEPVEAVLGKMLAQERAARYNSGGEFAAALARAVAGVGLEEAGEATVVEGSAWADDATVLTSGGAADTALMETMVGPAPARRRRWPLVLGALAVGLLLVAGVVLGVLLLAGGKGTERELEQAQAALAAGDYAGAADQFQRVLDGEPGSVAALEGLLDAAGGLAQAGQYEQAIETFGVVLEQDADNVEALKGMGEAYEAQEEWKQAAAWYERWTQVAPDDAEARLRLGEAFWKLEAYEQVIAQLTWVTTLRPDWAEGWEALGKIYYAGLKQYGNALEPLQKWAKLEPDSAEAQRVLGWTMFFQKEFIDAESYFLRCLELDAESGCYNGLASAYSAQEKWQEAVSVFEHLVRDDPMNSVAHQNLGDAYYNMQDCNTAIKSYLKAIELDDTNAKAYWGLGKCYTVVGDHLQARQAYERLVTLLSNNPQAHLGLGWALYELEDYQAAIQAFERANFLDTANPGAYLGLANSYYALGNEPTAVQYYEKWAALAGGSPFIHHQYGRVYYELIQYEAAAKAFSRALALDSQFVYGYVGLGQTQQAQGDCENARVSYQKALEIDPDNQSAKRGLQECKK